MIGRIEGRLAAIRGDRAVVDVGGVGYEVSMSARTVADLPPLGSELVLATHLQVREDGMTLYGFPTDAERDLFRLLLGASGVGPKVALAMLSVFSVDDLRKVVASEDVESLCRVPGIGKRTAQKIMLDLKPKFAAEEATILEGGSTAAQVRQALENLGYGPAEIRQAVAAVDAGAPLAEQIRQALRELGR